MGVLDWLFGRRDDGNRTDELLTRALDRTVEVVEPKLALARDWRKRLLPGVEAAVDIARSTALRLQQFHEASIAAWNADPVIRAMFATADDVARVLGRSKELERCLRAVGAEGDAYAVLGMDFETKRVLGAALEGNQVRHDVAMTQAQFSGHHIRIVAETPEALQRATGVRIFNQLLLAATKRLAETDEQRREMNVTRALLQARLRMLDHKEATFEPSVEGPDGESADPAVERADLERQLKGMSDAMEDLGAGVQGIDRQLEIVRDALLQARDELRVAPRSLRVDAMNTVLEGDAAGGTPVEFMQISTREFSRAYIGIHVLRANVSGGGLAFAEIERTL